MCAAVMASIILDLRVRIVSEDIASCVKQVTDLPL